MHGNMWLCETCKDREIRAMEQSAEMKRIVESSRKQDESIKVIPEIILAKSVALPQLQAAIQADDSIPADQKDYAYVKAIEARVIHFQSVVSAQMKSLNEAQNELRMWQTNGQTAAGKLREELRAQFKSLDVNYIPPKQPKIKKAASSPKASGKKSFDRAACNEAAAKWKVPAAQVQGIYYSKAEYSYDDAAQHLARLLGLIQ